MLHLFDFGSSQIHTRSCLNPGLSGDGQRTLPTPQVLWYRLGFGQDTASPLGSTRPEGCRWRPASECHCLKAVDVHTVCSEHSAALQVGCYLTLTLASGKCSVPRPGSPVPSTPERREGLRACYWEGPSELPERRSSSSAPRRDSAEPNNRSFGNVFLEWRI